MNNTSNILATGKIYGVQVSVRFIVHQGTAGIGH